MVRLLVELKAGRLHECVHAIHYAQVLYPRVAQVEPPPCSGEVQENPVTGLLKAECR